MVCVLLRYSALYVRDKEDRAGRHVSCIHYPLPPSQWYYPGNAAGNILIFGTVQDIFADTSLCLMISSSIFGDICRISTGFLIGAKLANVAFSLSKLAISKIFGEITVIWVEIPLKGFSARKFMLPQIHFFPEEKARWC